MGYASTAKIFTGRVENGKLLLADKETFNQFLTMLEGKQIELTIEEANATRTSQQNKALHKFFALVAQALEAAGYDRMKILSFAKVELPPTKDFVKYDLWAPIQQAVLGKASTTELSKKEDIDKVYDIMNRFLTEKLGLESIPFPAEPEEPKIEL